MKTYLSKWYWWVFLNKLWGRSLVLGSKFFAVSTPICGRKIEMFTSCAYQLNNDQQLYKFLPRGEEFYKHNFLVFHTRCKSAIGELNDIWTDSHRCKESNQNCGNNHRGKELPTRYTQHGRNVQLVHETRWIWQPSMDRVGGLWLVFSVHVFHGSSSFVELWLVHDFS